MRFPLLRLQRPMPATDVAGRVHARQLMALVRPVDVDPFGAAAGVVDLEGAAAAVPEVLVFEAEASVCGDGEEGEG